MIKHGSIKWVIIFILFFGINKSSPIDNPHFYRANFFWAEPRFQKDWLTTVDLSLGGGGTKSSCNQTGHKTDLLNIFGLHDMRLLGKNVSGLDPNNNLDAILLNLVETPERDNFGKLLFKGEFNIIEGVINAYQNVAKGFFVQAYLPIRRLLIKNIQFSDESPEDVIFPNKNTPVWVDFLGNFSQILERHSLGIRNVNRVGVGDFSLLTGWTINYQETEYLDFIDVTAKLGLLFPTAKTSNISNPFDVPLGYNGFYGFPLKFDCSFGYWEWLTWGMHIGALFLFERNKVIPMKTDQEQNGFITITSGEASVDSGTIWDIATYVKADHFFKGLSFYVGYCYTQKDADCI